MNKSFRTIIFLLLIKTIIPAQFTQPLFFMEHSINKNKIYYELQLAKDSAIEPLKPIHAFWIMWEKDSTGKLREDMSVIEKRMAYGFKVGTDSSKKFITINLVAFPGRTVTVVQKGKENPRAEVIINGRNAVLEKIFIKTLKDKIFPKVDYIELFGKNISTGNDCEEKIYAPKK